MKTQSQKQLQTTVRKATLLALVAILACSSQAAIEGEPDTISSTGAVQVSLSITPSIQLQTVEDIRLNITDRKSDNHFQQSFCVTGNRFGKYNVTATGSFQTEEFFILYNAQHDELPYTVSYKGSYDAQGYDLLLPGRASKTYDVTPYASGCQKSAYFMITFRSVDLTRVKSGLYTGDLTLTVSPI